MSYSPEFDDVQSHNQVGRLIPDDTSNQDHSTSARNRSDRYEIHEDMAIDEHSPSLSSIEHQHSTPHMSTSNKPAEFIPSEVRSPGAAGHQNLLKLWWKEIVCCMISLGGVLAIVAILYSHEAKPSPSWQFGLTVNTVIAILTVVIKTSGGFVLGEGISHIKWAILARPQRLSTITAHDNASRGTTGSLELLWKNRYRTADFQALPIISSFGAIITILILLLDPFSQQIIRNYECVQPTLENATIARTNIYSEVGQQISFINGYNMVLPIIRRVINNGFFATRQSQPDFTCHTGNCAFERYSTVAFCSTCEDASSELNFTSYQRGQVGSYVEWINVTLPVADDILTLSRPKNLSEYWGAETQDMAMRFCPTTPMFGMINWKPPTRGYRCLLFPCVQTLESKVVNGRMEEKVVEVMADSWQLVEPSSLGDWNESAMSAADLNCLDNTYQRQILKDLGYAFNDTTRWLPYNVTISNGTVDNPGYLPASPLKDGNPCQKAPGNLHLDLCNGNQTTKKALEAVPARCIYSMEVGLVMSLWNNLWYNMLQGSVYADMNFDYEGASGSEIALAVFNAGSGNRTLEDLQEIMYNMTNALTTHIRQNGKKGFDQPATGQSFRYTTCVRVRWVWLTYVAVIVGLLLVFFWAMVAFARISPQWDNGSQTAFYQDFKSSILPVFFHGLDRDSLKQLEDVSNSNQEKDLEEKTKDVWVKFVATEHGLKLSVVTA